MSEDQSTGGVPPGESQSQSGESNQTRSIESVTAEFARKTSRLSEENALLSQKLDQLTQMIAQGRGGSQNSGTEEANLEELIYKDPKAYAKAVEQNATRRAEEMVNSRMQYQNEAQSVLAQLSSEYPELADANSELTKKAVEIYKSLPVNQQANPLAYKIAVRDAAADMGVLVKSKRQSASSKSHDEFQASSSPGDRQSSRGAQSKEVDQKTLAFAELIGVNIKDKKVMERIQERAKRKNWGKWE